MTKPDLRRCQWSLIDGWNCTIHLLYLFWLLAVFLSLPLFFIQTVWGNDWSNAFFSPKKAWPLDLIRYWGKPPLIMIIEYAGATSYYCDVLLSDLSLDPFKLHWFEKDWQIELEIRPKLISNKNFRNTSLGNIIGTFFPLIWCIVKIVHTIFIEQFFIFFPLSVLKLLSMFWSEKLN